MVMRARNHTFCQSSNHPVLYFFGSIKFRFSDSRSNVKKLDCVLIFNMAEQHRIPKKLTAIVSGILLVGIICFVFWDNRLQPTVPGWVVHTADPKRCEENLYNVTRYEHVAGTPEDKKSAEWILQKFEEAGLEAALYPTDSFVSYPTARPVVQLFDEKDKVVFDAKLSEDILEQDNTSSIKTNKTRNSVHFFRQL